MWRLGALVKRNADARRGIFLARSHGGCVGIHVGGMPNKVEITTVVGIQSTQPFPVDNIFCKQGPVAIFPSIASFAANALVFVYLGVDKGLGGISTSNFIVFVRTRRRQMPVGSLAILS